VSAVDPLAARLAALSTALDLGGDRMDPRSVDSARALLDRAGERLLLSTEHTVVALAGATGSGKSTLFNALAGLELARTGVRRPTTSEPLACVWGPEGAGPLLEWLGIPRRHQVTRESALDAETQAYLRGLVLLDLPDHDSTELAHRLEVDRLVDMVDLIVWVVDPQKYADAALHDRYLRPLAGHGAVTRVVLNQVDRLDPASAQACRSDVERLLREDGLADPKVLPVSARTGEGLFELRSDLAAAVTGRAARVRRIEADLDRVLPSLLASVEGSAGTVDRSRRTALVDALATAAGVPGVVHAVDRSVRHRAVAATGWPFTRWVRRLRPDPLRRLGLTRGDSGGRSSVPEATRTSRAQVELAVRQVADAAAGTLPPPWAEGVRDAARGGQGDLADALDRAVVSTDLGADRGGWWWPVASALQWALAVTALVGLGWLALLGVMGYFRLPELGTPSVEGVPVPTALALGGLAGGLLLALISRLLAALAARGRAARARSRLRHAVEEVAQAHVLKPVDAEVERWREVRTSLRAAGG
jgi:GTP-binding protein EngB required for normal cell division